MLDALTATIKATLSFNYTIFAVNRVAGKTQDEVESYDAGTGGGFTFGTAAGKANQVFNDTGALAATTSVDLNFRNASLKNPGGQTIAMTSIVSILVENSGATVLEVFGEATHDPISICKVANSANSAQKIRPGGAYFLSAGVTDATGYAWTATDVLRIKNTDGAVAGAYKCTVIGRE